MNEAMLKKIVSVFIKKPINTIQNDTIIDNSVIQGSVLFHRMISRINDFYDIEIENYGDIGNYSNLLRIVQQKLDLHIENSN